MNRVAFFWNSTIGKKMIMAVTGFVMVGFVIGHMAGNLKMFVPCEVPGSCKTDHYAEFLRTFGADLVGKTGFLWVVRFGLLGAAVLHVICAVQLSLRNRIARASIAESNSVFGQRYVGQKFQSATIASRTMAYGGTVLALFIIFHILHFTTGTVHTHGFIEGHVYHNVTSAFSSPLLVLIYLIAMAALGLHLYHGSWSMFQTLGIDSTSWNKGLRCGVKVMAIVVFLGFVSVPLGVLLGVIPK